MKLGPGRLSDRLEEMAGMLRFEARNNSGEVTTGSVRLRLYLMSIQTGLASVRNFLFGIGEHISNVDVLNSLGIGAHSSILDRFAEYGIIGMICIYKIFSITFKKCYNREKGMREAAFRKCIFVLFIINAFINNVFTITVLLVIFTLIPNEEAVEKSGKSNFV